MCVCLCSLLALTATLKLSPGFQGDFCSESAGAGAPWRCQPRSNLMPELPGFRQGLNLNLGKEKEERKAPDSCPVTGLVLNPSLLCSQVAFVPGAGMGSLPAWWSSAREGCVCDFKPPNPCSTALQGAGGIWMPPAELAMDGRLHPKA